MKRLVIGKVKSQELAEWLGVSYTSYRRTKAKRLKELEYFCEFKELLK